MTFSATANQDSLRPKVVVVAGLLVGLLSFAGLLAQGDSEGELPASVESESAQGFGSATEPDSFDGRLKSLQDRIQYFYEADNEPAPYKGERLFSGHSLSPSTYTSFDLQEASVGLYEGIRQALSKRDDLDDIEGFNADLIAIIDKHHLMPASAVAALHLAEFEYLIGNLNAAMSLAMYIAGAHRHSGVALDAMLLLAEIFFRYEYVKDAEKILKRLRSLRRKRTAQQERSQAKLQDLKPPLNHRVSFLDGEGLRSSGVQQHLKFVAGVLEKNPKWSLEIRAHVDPSEIGSGGAVAFTERRALEVKRDLTSRFGIDERRVGAKGMGLLVPVASSKTKEGRQQNQRIELYFVKPKNSAD